MLNAHIARRRFAQSQLKEIDQRLKDADLDAAERDYLMGRKEIFEEAVAE